MTYFFGDGTANRGPFHEALNWAAVQKLPCIYFCENNGFAISMPTSRSTAVENIADRAAGYNVPGVVVDGNDPVAVYEVMEQAVARARAGHGPTLIEAKVTRLHGHYVADQQEYRTDLDQVAEKDPLPKLQQTLCDRGMLTQSDVDDIQADADQQVEAAVAAMRAAPLLSRRKSPCKMCMRSEQPNPQYPAPQECLCQPGPIARRLTTRSPKKCSAMKT